MQYHNLYIVLADQIVNLAKKSHNTLQLQMAISFEMNHI